jgi:hypothetical protein
MSGAAACGELLLELLNLHPSPEITVKTGERVAIQHLHHGLLLLLTYNGQGRERPFSNRCPAQ